jgi:hypothetical protein
MIIRILSIATGVLLGTNVLAQSTANNQLQERSKELLRADVSLYQNEEAYHLPWERIMEKDVLWAKIVWRTIDIHDAANSAFSGDKQLVNVLIEGALGGKITLYDAANDRFTNELSKEDIVALVAPAKGRKAIKPSSITRYMVKEQWVFTNQGKMVVRIVGIAPMKDATNALFWTFFPGDREYLAQVNTANGKNWDLVFSNREFKSTIEKVNEDVRAQRLEKE